MAANPQFTIRVRGAENLARTLRAAGQNVNRMDAIGRTAGTIVVNRARVHCPVDTGALQGSIRVRGRRNGVEVVASENLAYGNAQHWGYPPHNIRATLFMVRGMQEAEPEVVRLYEGEIQKIMSQVRGA